MPSNNENTSLRSGSVLVSEGKNGTQRKERERERDEKEI
jgi:hypothetical protein